MRTDREQVEEMRESIPQTIIAYDMNPNGQHLYGEQREYIAEALYDAGYRKAGNVYIIISPEGGIALNIYSGKGTVYADKAKAEEALRRKNEWSKIKGYGIYELVELEVEE